MVSTQKVEKQKLKLTKTQFIQLNVDRLHKYIWEKTIMGQRFGSSSSYDLAQFIMKDTQFIMPNLWWGKWSGSFKEDGLKKAATNQYTRALKKFKALYDIIGHGPVGTFL
jgi:hypothetical protein